MNKALKDLAEKLDGEVHQDSLHKKLYATDASVYRKLPEAVAFPKTEADIIHLVKFATAEGVSLIPRAAGTSLAGQCVGSGIVVDVSRYLNSILDLDVVNKTVTVQPGVIRDELNEYLLPYGLFFGPNTSTSNRCMIGGMVGNNSSGTTSIKYGVTRDKVVRLKTVLSDGEVVVFESITKNDFEEKAAADTLEGKIYRTLRSELSSEENIKEIMTEFPRPEIHRRNTGYAVDLLLDSQVFSDSDKEINLCKLLCGSEGTLAFTTEITLSLDELQPQFTAMVVPQYDDLQQCLSDVLVAMKHDLYMCELMDDVILDCTRDNKKYEAYRFFVQGQPKAVLMLELRSDDEADLELQVKELLKTLELSENSYTRPVLMGGEIEMAFELRKAGLGLLGNMTGDKKAVACIEDTAVALEDLPSFIAEFSALMDEFDQRAVYYAHAGAGELHLRPILNLKDRKGVEYFRSITTRVAMLTKKYRGSFSGEHGDGIVRGEFLPLLIGEHNYHLLKRIKHAFDPDNIFNPGKIINGAKMDENLRYETDRAEPGVETILDFSASMGLIRMAENCNGSGDCRKTENSTGVMCPSYHATRNEKDTTRGRANILREVLTNNRAANKFDSQDLKEAFDLCLSCKACASECPSNVDMAVAKAEFQYQYNKLHGTSFATRLFARSSKYSKIASKYPKLANFLITNRITSGLVKDISGISRQRSIPTYSTKTFTKILQSTQNQSYTAEKSVFLFVDEFSNYLDAEIAWDAYELLQKLGYNVLIIDQLDSARALISKGFLQEAKTQIDKNIEALKEIVTPERPLLGIEPSALLGFRDEYPRLATDRTAAMTLSKSCLLVEEFLVAEANKGRIKAEQFTNKRESIKIHVHCHQKALSNQKVTFDMLNLPLNYHPVIIPAGCCGMAGSFGYEADHYELSMEIGELKLFPAIRKASTQDIIAANGTSCRHQIKDGTDRTALHPLTIMRHALR